jgi:tRNA threonylcarbamoyladenosine biosynthesis protein TsaE
MSGDDVPRAPVPMPPLAGHGHLALTRGELAAWGERFGHAVVPPLVVALSGELGAGKTTLVQAICRGYGVTEEVTSPTFSIVHRYRGAASDVVHLDLYRLNGEPDLLRIGWDELLQEPALILIEWPERAAGLLPPHHVPMELRHLADQPERRLLYAGGHT